MKRLLVIVLTVCLMMPLITVHNASADVKSVTVVPYPKKAGKMASYHISFNVNRPLEANRDSIELTLPQETQVPEFVSSSVISVNPQKLIGADYKLNYETGDIQFTDPLREGDMIRASYTYVASPDYTMMPIQSDVKFFDRSFDILSGATDPRSNNGQFDPGEWVYEDRDKNGRISPGDRRLMVIHQVLGGVGGNDAKQNSIVADGDGDCAVNASGDPIYPLVPLSIVNLVMMDQNNDGIYNEGDYLLDDRDHSNTVSSGDNMIAGVAHYPAGTTVSYNDHDYRDRTGGFFIESFDGGAGNNIYRHVDDGMTVGSYDPGEAIYLDGDVGLAGLSTYSVDAGDYRSTSVTVIQNGVTYYYPSNTLVVLGDRDIGTKLINFKPATGEEEGYLDLDGGQTYDTGEPIYSNGNGRSTFLSGADFPQPGDRRLSSWSVAAYHPSSLVNGTGVTEADENYQLASFNTSPTHVPELMVQVAGLPLAISDVSLFPNYTGSKFDYTTGPLGSTTPADRTVGGTAVLDTWLYRDNDRSSTVSVGDERLTDVRILFGTNLIHYSAGSVVKEGELDFIPISVNAPQLMLGPPVTVNPGAPPYNPMRHTETIVNNMYDPAELIYEDADNNNIVSPNDVRLVPVGVTSFGNKPITADFPLIGATLTKGWARIENKVIVPFATAGTTTAKLDNNAVKVLPTLEPPQPPSYLSANTFTLPGGNTPLSGSGEWWIKVTAINEYGEGEFSDSIQINFNSAGTENAVEIDWTPVPYAKAYRIYKSRNETYFPHSALLAEVKAPTSNYIDRGTTITEGTLPYPYEASFVTLWRGRNGVETELVEYKCADYEINLDTGMISFRRALKPYEIVLADYKYADGKSQIGPSGDPCTTVGHVDENVFVDVQHGTGQLLHNPAVDPSIDPLHYCFRLWRAPTIDPENPYLLREGSDYTINYETGEIQFAAHVITSGDIITADYDSYEEVMGESLVEAISSGITSARCQAPVLPESYTISKAVALKSSPQIKITNGPNGHQLIFTTPVDIFVDPDNDQSTPDVVMTLNRPGRQFNTYDKGAVRNPQKAGSYQLWVSTSQEQTPILSSPYEITADTSSENMKLKIISPQVPPQQPNDPPCDCKDAAGTAGQVMSIAAQLTDGSNGISGVYIRFQIDDTVNPPSTFSSSNLVQTNDQGLASVVLNLSATPGVTRIKVYLQDDPSICRCVDINTGPPVEVDRIVISPGPTLALSPGTLQQFTATAFKSNGAQIPGVEFTWASDCGSINQAGLYTAPVDAGSTCHVFARAHGKEGMTTVSIVSRPSRITVNPPSAIVASGSQKQFTAQAYDDIGNPMSIPINWSIEPAGLGTFTSDGTFTAGNISGTGTVKACSAGVCGTATVTVQTAGNITSVKVTPANATMKIGQTQQFTAKALDQNGFEVQGASFTWMVQPSTMGTISSNGLFVASSPGTAIITAQSGSVTGMAIVNIVEISRIEINPSGLTKVARGDTQLFTAVAYNTAGAAIPGMNFNWSVTPAGVGTLTPSGSTATFTATGMDGQKAIIMIEAAGLTATAQVQIGAKDSTPPTVTSSPDSGIKDGETALVGTGQIKVSVSDSEGIATVSVNGVPATSDGQGNWVATVNVNKGSNEFIVKAVDNNGNEAEETIRAYGSYQTEMILNIRATEPYVTLTKDGSTSQVKLNTVPEIYGGRTYVGLRDLGEKLLGGNVEYDTNTKMITITIPRSNGNTDVLQTVIGQNDFRVTRTTPTGQQTVEDYVLENPPYISNYPYASHFKSVNKDRTMVPMRSIVEAVVGKTVEQTGQNSVDYDSLTENATFRFIP